MLRSKYADAQVPTELELLFENGGQEYKVRRNPEYERPAKKGGGMTLQRAEAELTYPDGRVVTKQKEVNKANFRSESKSISSNRDDCTGRFSKIITGRYKRKTGNFPGDF